jgi:hypothetical protein
MRGREVFKFEFDAAALNAHPLTGPARNRSRFCSYSSSALAASIHVMSIPAWRYHRRTS